MRSGAALSVVPLCYCSVVIVYHGYHGDGGGDDGGDDSVVVCCLHCLSCSGPGRCLDGLQSSDCGDNRWAGDCFSLGGPSEDHWEAGK